MNAFFDFRSGAHRSLCLVLAALTAMSPALVAAQQPATAAQPAAAAATAPAAPIDLSYAAPIPCAIVAIRPAQVLNSAVAELLPTEVMQVAGQEHLGFDPLTIEQIVFSASPPGIGQPSYSVYAHLAAPLVLKPSPLTQHTQPGTANGKAYLQSVQPALPSIYQPDARSVVVAPDFAIQGNASAPAAAPVVGSLAARFAAADKGDDLLAMIDMAALRPLIGMAIAQGPPLPPEFAFVRDIPMMVSAIELRVNLSHEGPTELIARANHAADANRIAAAIERLKQTAIAKIEKEVEQEYPGNDPTSQAMVRYQKRLARAMYEQFKVSVEADAVVLARTDMSKGSNPAVYVATIGVLVALLLPAIQAARAAARRATSMNNMKQIMLGLLNYESAKGQFPAHAICSADGKPLLSWRVHMLPFMDQMPLYQQFHLDEPWDSEHNKALIPLMPAFYLDPASSHAQTDGLSNYLGAKGKDRFFNGSPEGRRMASVRDGTSNTIAVVQVNDDRAVAWTRPDDWELDETTPMAGLGGLHTGGIFVAGFCDGHVVVVNTEIDLTVFKAMLTTAGGEVLNGFR